MRYTYLTRLSIIVLFAAGICNQAIAQSTKDSRTFKGTVKDRNNQPIAGATIAIQEVTTSVITDADGRFSIDAALKDVLVIKKDGYLSQRKVINDTAEIAIDLIKALTDAGDDDDVNIPFGIRKKRQENSAVYTLNTKNLPQIPLSNVTNILAGRIPGLYVQQTGSAPGADNASLQIRGRSTFGPSGLKILVDGVQRDFADFDVNEIESVTVLKDAASQAWYGLRGGNGIILVTTKKGNPLKSSINFDVQGGIQMPENLIKPLNSYEFASLYNEASVNDGVSKVYDDAALAAYQNGSDPFKYPNNNYTDKFLNTASPIQRYVLSADGGSNVARYFILMSYMNQAGLYKYSKNDEYNSNINFGRFNFRGNVDFDITDNFTVGLNVGGRSENRRQPGNNESGAFLDYIYNLPPNAFPVLNADESYGGNSQFQNNPMGLIREKGYQSTIDRVMMATLDARHKLNFITRGLSANINFSYDAQGTYVSGLTQDYEVKDMTGAGPAFFRNKTPLGYRNSTFSASNRKNELWAGLDYNRDFGNHSVTAALRGHRFVNAAPERLDFRGQGVSARADYSFAQKYYLGFVGSYSGSENFPPGKRYGFFPAVTAGWVVSDDFIKNNKILSYVKLRGSFGQVGSSDIGGNRFPFERFFSRNNTGGGYVFGTGFSASNSSTEVSIANPEITWETVTTLNAGIDFKLFNNSLSASVDYFDLRREGILTPAATSSILGASLIVNAGEVTSKGMDLSLNYDKKVGQFDISVNGNFAMSRDIVISENGQDGLPEYQRTTDRLLGGRLVFVSNGLFQNQADIQNAARQVLSGRVIPGDIRYVDVGGTKGIPDGIIDNLDRIRIDERDFPKLYYGFGFVIKYKLFDLSTQFQGVYGRTMDIQGIVNSGPFTFNKESLKRWTPENAATAEYPRLGLTDRANNTTGSDFWVVSGDYLKVKHVEVGFTFPPSIFKRYRVRNARFYIGAFNLFSFDKVPLDIDPEIPSAGRGTNYPYLKTMYAGLRTTF